MNGGATNPVQGAVSTTMADINAPGASLTPGYGSMVSLLSALAPQALKQSMAANAVSGLPEAYSGAGGPSGFGGGILNNIVAHLVPGSAPATYSAEQQAAAAQLAAVLGITPEAALKLLPTMTQTPQSSIPSQQNVGSLLNTLTAGAQ